MDDRNDARITARLPKSLITRVNRNLPKLHRYLERLGLASMMSKENRMSVFVRTALEKLSTDLETSDTTETPEDSPPSALELFPVDSERGAAKRGPKSVPGKSKGGRDGMKRPWPVDFVLTPGLREYAMEKLGCSGGEVSLIWEAFEAYHGANRSLFTNWQKAWVTWVLRELNQRARQSRYLGHRNISTLEERVAKAKSKFSK